MILNDRAVNALKSRAERRNGISVSNADVLSLIDTIDDLRHRKKQWQRLATARGAQLREIAKLAHMQEENYG